MRHSYLVVIIDCFRLQAALRLQAEGGPPPAVLCDERGRVVEANSLALTRGVTPGMSAAKAMGRCRQLRVLSQSDVSEQAAERVLWHCLWQLTPQIELTAPGWATLELVKADWSALTPAVEAAIKQLNEHGLPARAGAAATPEWAHYAAVAAETGRFKRIIDERRMDELLGSLPLFAAPGLAAETAEILESWGIRHLAGFSRLPRQEVGERLGPEARRIWDELNGQASRRLQFTRLEPAYAERFELEDPVTDLEPLRFLIRRACESLELQLQGAQKLAQQVHLELHIESGRPHRKAIRLPEATRRAGLLERLLLHHLEQVRFEGAICEVVLQVSPVEALARQSGLFERSVSNPWRLQETLDQLAGLVGPENFGRPKVLPTHRPDAFTLEALPAEIPEAPAQDAAELQGPPDFGPPLRRYRPPLPAEVSLRRGRPAELTCPLVKGRIAELLGPYRADGDWWAGDAWRQVEWDVALAGGGLFRLGQIEKQWCLVGSYD